MSEGLVALKELRENGAVSFSRATISFTYLAFTKRAGIIEKELKEREQYKAIEQELGIDLVTLFGILRTGGCIWVKNCKGINQWHVESLKQRGLDKQWYLTYSNNVRVKLKDYGKTWALTKEELEK